MPQDLIIGTAVAILSHEGEPLALGHYCGKNGLVIRICSFDTSEELNEEFWRRRFTRALKLREALFLPNQNTTGYRLIHGEGDLLSGLVCDIYGKAASIKLSNPGLGAIVQLLCEFLQKSLGIEHIFFEKEGQEPRELLGSSAEALFLEEGLTFTAHFNLGQKTGYFLDQRENRLLIKKYAQARRVLDAFSYAGGFSVYALAAGAKCVTSVDLSDKAVAWCTANVAANGPFVGSHRSLTEDCFSYLRTIKKGEFDLIVLDPPAFAKSANAIERAARGYKDINLLALKALDEDGVLFTFSCSQHISTDLFKKIIFAAAKDSGRQVAILHELVQGPDHPVSIYCPQSSYLKGLVLKVD